MTLRELHAKLIEIKNLGYIPTHRVGDTGIGKTLEDLLDIEENNIPLADIGGVAELKAVRNGSTSMLTLFTLEPSPTGGDRDRLLLDNFGYSNRENGRPKELHVSVTNGRYNNQSLKLTAEANKIRVTSNRQEINIFWDVASLRNKFNDKLPALVYVIADSRMIDGRENFHYTTAYFLSGFSFSKFKRMLTQDKIVVDFRMYYRPNGSVRNHGTGFRVKSNSIYNCFSIKQTLL